MTFKMKGFPKHKGTKGFAKTEYVPQSVRFNKGKNLEPDPEDPNQWSAYSDADYISIGDSPSGDKAMDRLPGEGVVRKTKGRLTGSTQATDEYHEAYPGLKDEGAGYDQFNLGARNKQEQQDYDRYVKDLSKTIKNYRGDLPISGDLQMDDASFEAWKQSTNSTGPDSKLRKRFEDETTQALNIHNELKLAADEGYTPNMGMVGSKLDKLGIDFKEGDYKLNENKARLHADNAELRNISVANRKATDAKRRVEEHIEKYGGTAADYLRNKPHLKDDLQGIHSFGQVDVDTKSFFDDAMYADMSKKEKRKYDRQKKKEEQEKANIESDIQANLPADSEEFNIPEEPSIMGSEGGNESVDANVNETITSDNESKEKTYDPRDTNKDGIVDRKEKRAAMFADSATPQSAMTRKNPYEFGTDEYYDFKKTALSKKVGLTKRIFNIYDNK